jgi:hypothetical protein
MQNLPLVLDFPMIGGAAGRPQELPDEAYVKRRYDSEATSEFLRWLVLQPQVIDPFVFFLPGLVM